MRILLTSDPGIAVPPLAYGGIERIVDTLLRHYRKEGHTVALWADEASTCPADVFYPCRTVPAGNFSQLKTAWQLKQANSEFKPDLIHSFSRLSYLLPLLPSRLPKIMSYQRHTGGANIQMARMLAGDSLTFTGCSDFICRMGARAGGKWHNIPNFVDPDHYTFVPQVSHDAPLVFLSRVESIKGPDWAIKIALKTGRRLIIAGNKPEGGPELDFWNLAIEPHLNKNGIEWIGPVDDRQKNKLLGQAAAMIVPIQWDEPFGIVFAESLACGTPVISCPRGALPEIIEQGRHGYLINSLEEGVTAVNALGKISRADCHSRMLERYSVEKAVLSYTTLYRKLINA